MNWEDKVYFKLCEKHEAATMDQLFAAQDATTKTNAAKFIKKFGKGTTVKPVKVDRISQTRPGWTGGSPRGRRT